MESRKQTPLNLNPAVVDAIRNAPWGRPSFFVFLWSARLRSSLNGSHPKGELRSSWKSLRTNPQGSSTVRVHRAGRGARHYRRPR